MLYQLSYSRMPPTATGPPDGRQTYGPGRVRVNQRQFEDGAQTQHRAGESPCFLVPDSDFLLPESQRPFMGGAGGACIFSLLPPCANASAAFVSNTGPV